LLISDECDFFTANSRNIYTVKNYTLTQYSLSGEKQKQYSSPALGNISKIDAGDPFRILVFYKDFNSLMLLDNQLAPLTQSALNLDMIGVNEVTQVCASNGMGFWVYNQNSFQLEKYNYRLHLLQKSTKLDMIIKRNEIPDFLDEYQNKVYLGFKNKGVYVFDSFGGFEKFIPLKYKEHIQIVNNYIFYDKDTLYRYDMKNFKLNSFEFDFSEYNDFCIVQNKIIVGEGKNIYELGGKQ
jgi:hypothetical protein